MRRFVIKTLTLLAFLIGLASMATAQTSVNLVITKTNGEEQTFLLSGQSQLSFENGEYLVIDDGTDNTFTYPLNQIRKMVCTEILGTSEESDSQLQIFPNPSRDSFVIRNLQGKGLARIYTLDGRLMQSFEATEGMVVSIAELSSGMYLLNVNGQTLKLMKL